MHEYYFKIRKDNIEFEFSTTDKVTFEQQLSDWINGIVQGKPIQAPADERVQSFEEKPERSGFIDVKNLASINEIQAPDFEFSETKNNIEEEAASFETALSASINNPMTEVVEKADATSNFEGFFAKYSPESALDKLIVTSLFILNEENQERFTLKSINSKLVPLCGSPVDHATMQEAIEQAYVRVVPDLTETSEFTEYTLTPEGEGYFVV